MDCAQRLEDVAAALVPTMLLMNRPVTRAATGAFYSKLRELPLELGALRVLGPSKARRRAPPQLLAPEDWVRAKKKTS